MRKKIIFSLIFICSIFLIGCQIKNSEDKKTKFLQEEIPVKVMKVRPKTIMNVLEYVGNIKAEEEAIIYPKVTGKIVKKVKEESDLVEKEEIIVYIDRDEVGLAFKLAPVTSTLNGIVGKIFVDIGQQVNLQTPIALVLDIDKVKINLEIPEKYLDKIKVNQEAIIKVDAYEDREFVGRLTKIIPMVDLVTRTFSVEILVDNNEHLLKPGMFAKVTLILEKYQDALVVLKEAVLGKEPDLFVYVVEANKAFLRKVKLGLQEGPYVQIKEGLNEGDLVVIMGQQKLYNGAIVSVQEENNKEEN